MKYIELPRKVLVGDGVVDKTREVVKDLRLKGECIVVADETTLKVAGDKIASDLDASTYIAGRDAVKEIEKLEKEIKNCGYIISCGGGLVNDITKMASFEENIPYINFPTSASHDGIASPQTSLKGEKPISLKTHCPMAVIADTKVIRKAPTRLNASGCADAISNYSAVLDWKLARDEKREYYGDYAAALSEMSSRIVMENARNIKNDVNVLVEALISSGVAIGIAGSSRPCSGSEHLFSHALDMILDKPALHGEQCGLGTIIASYLHGEDWATVKDALKKCGAPTTAKQVKIPEDKIIEALTTAHKIRDRYTILRDGLSEKQALEAAEETGVI